MQVSRVHRLLSGVLLTGVAVSLTPASSPAATRPTWTVAPGGSFSDAHKLTSLTDTTTGTVLTCSRTNLAGTMKTGSGLAGADLASVTSATFTTCTNPLITRARPLVTMIVTADDFPWKLDASAYDSATGVTSGKITGIHLALSGTGCSAVIGGTTAAADNGQVKFSYANGTNKLTILSSGGNLHVWDVSGCFGLYNTGDHFRMNGGYPVKPPQRITSP
jgi:hypothetical protein